jgi:glycosyltransferase involved in cell wall biosynthesis
VIPHGITARQVPLPPPETPTVLLFGRLEAYKGVEVLVDAMRILWEHRPDVRLIVAGQGDAARLVPSDPRITLMARYISEHDIEALLSRASVVALPYTQASQSGVGLLAIAAGVPVVVSDLGGLPELAPEASFVAEPGRPDMLADALRRHVDDGLDVRRDVLRHARGHFSWEHAAQLTTELYDELMARS